MLNRNRLSCAVLLLTVATPVFAQDAHSSTASDEVIQDPMPHSRAAGSPQTGPAQTAAPSSAAPSAAQGDATSPAAPASESEAARKTTFSVNPAMLLLGGFGAELETAIEPGLSLFVAPSFIFGSSVLTPQTNVSVSGFGLDLGLRFFSEKDAPRGFWIGPYGSFGFASATAGNIKVDATALRIGGMLGYSWIFDNAIYLSLGAGGGYQTILVGTSSTGGLAASLRLAIGFAL